MTEKKFQTRSEVNGLRYFDTIDETIAHARADKTVWKVSYTEYTGERVRFVKNANNLWIEEPLVDDSTARKEDT